MQGTGKKALIAMSGGVDSSVAAHLTQAAGYSCIGCTMRLYDADTAGTPRENGCCSLSDVEDARAVAYRLGMPYYVFNFCAEFRASVLQNFIDVYTDGRTPNPCIECNRYMKFAKLLERARVLGCDVLVTGHYARIGQEGGRYTLQKALDPAKDQSYVLYMLTQEQLAHIRFPLGTLTKAEVRALAQANGFVNAAKRDSQDLCFVPDGDYPAAIRRLTGRTPTPGDYLDTAGRVIGRHKGIEYYTVGQHKGLGLSTAEPLYVLAIDAARNTVTLGPNEALFRTAARVESVNWIAGAPPAGRVCCTAKVRYRQAEQPAAVTPTGPDTALLEFDAPQRAITPGQAAVFYDGDTVLGGGVLAWPAG